MDEADQSLLKTLALVAGGLLVAFLLWQTGTIEALRHGRLPTPPLNAEAACGLARGMAMVPIRDAGGGNAKVLRFEADCDARRLTMITTVNASSRQLTQGNAQSVADAVGQQLCSTTGFAQLATLGWTLGVSMSFADQVTRKVDATACS